MPVWVWLILLQIVLILLNALFAGSEIAVLSVNDYKLNKLASPDSKKVKALKWLADNPSRFLSTIQIAITLSGFLGSAFAADNFSESLVNLMVSMGIRLPHDVLDSIAVIVITLILSYFTLVFGELVPKQIAIHKSEQFSLAVSRLIASIARIFAPLVKVLTWSTNFVLKLLHINPDQEEDEVSEEEIIMMVNAGRQKGTIDEDESEMIQNVFAFDNLEARDLITHRSRIEGINLDKPETWQQSIQDSTHSLIPVYHSSPDHIDGILNIKLYFRSKEPDLKKRILESLEEPYFVFENMRADNLFEDMKKNHQKMAVVLDEYGGVSGLITMNDLIGELVGQFDQDNEPEIEKLSSTSWRMLGRTSIQDVNRELGTHANPDLVSLNGLIFDLLGHVPDGDEKESVQLENYKIQIERLNRHSVESALITRLEPAPSEKPESTDSKAEKARK